MSAHFQFGNELLRADVRAQAIAIATLIPDATVAIHISTTELLALLRGAVVVNAAPAPVTNVVNTTQPAPAPKPAAAPAATGERFRRTAAETEAGLSVEEAKFFRQSGGGDPVAYKAGLAKADEGDTGVTTPVPETNVDPGAAVGDAEDAVDATLSKSDAPVIVTEQDVRDAAALAVKNKRVDDVKKIAADYGVKNWKELDPSKLGEVLTKLTALITVG